uniref:Uncharacterized protein n=1 Tax=viral metagenome TaxID=1070528 RepID=A0A6M3J5Y6_9ZZZZ
MTTKITWTDETWNPITGCTKISEGCAHCYAARMAKRLAGRHGYPEAPHEFDVTMHHDRLDQPLQWKKPRRVFVCSMSDLFHDDVPWQFISEVFAVMAQTKHTFQVLTKRPRNLNTWQGWSGWLEPRVWLGVTAENQHRANKRIPLLLQTPAAVRFVSVEPMLGPVDLDRFLPYKTDSGASDPNTGAGINVLYPGLDWVICGCESGPGRRPMKLEWAIDLVRQCQSAGVSIFVKQIEIDGVVSHDPAEWPEELRVQEWPI